MGRLVGIAPDGVPLVELTGGPTVRARSFLSLSDAELRARVQDRPEALLMFENGDLAHPLLVALRTTPTLSPILDALMSAPPELEASADGARVQIEAAQEIVLKCGEASLTLRRNGEVVLRGVKLESRATGRNIIRGRKIALN